MFGQDEATRRVFITDTTLRDAHQSLFATRMSLEQMEPALEMLDEVGFFSLEMWGGATFDAAIRFLKENPWERLRRIRAKVKKTRLQMLLRGRNLVGYRHYPKDVATRVIELAAEYGIDIFRIFDALNDPANMELAVSIVKKCGRVAEGAISYTTSPVHTIDAFVQFAKQLRDMGCDLICVKDMAGLLTPTAAYELVSALVDEVKLPVHLHCHCTSGMAEMAYWKGIEAGARIIDCAISPLSGATSQPATETFVAALASTPHDTKINLAKLRPIAQHFLKVREELEKLVGRPRSFVDVNVLHYQVPGGMMSNLIRQLKEQNALERLSEVLEEIPQVRADLGYPPLVTPTSQIVGIQSAVNVLFNRRYATLLEETKDLVNGKYGRLPGCVKGELVERAQKSATKRGEEPPITLQQARQQEGVESDEDAVTYALFPKNWNLYLQIKKRTAIECEQPKEY